MDDIGLLDCVLAGEMLKRLGFCRVLVSDASQWSKEGLGSSDQDLSILKLGSFWPHALRCHQLGASFCGAEITPVAS